MTLRVFALILALLASAAGSAELQADSAASLEKALKSSVPGDTITLASGIYEGNFSITKSIVLKGTEKAVIDGGDIGSCLVVEADNVTLENLSLQNCGKDLYERQSGVLIKEGFSGIDIKNLKINTAGFGIRADKASDIKSSGCKIRGYKRRHVLDRGDGVYFNYVKNAELVNNRVLYTRDGFYFENTDNTISEDNYFAALQYGIHYMYTRGDSAFNNEAEACIGGYAVMSSERVRVADNTSKRTVEFGILLNESDKSTVENNHVTKVKNPRGKASLDTEGKGLFIYGGGTNTVDGNTFEECEIGVGVAMGGEGTILSRNRFIHNRQQVRYVGSGSVEWSINGVGNFWSNYQGWDLNQDGIGDQAYQPNDSLDRLFWMYPQARFLMNSPLASLLRYLNAQFQLDKGKGIVDSNPLIQDPLKPKKDWPVSSN